MKRGKRGGSHYNNRATGSADLFSQALGEEKKPVMKNQETVNEYTTDTNNNNKSKKNNDFQNNNKSYSKGANASSSKSGNNQKHSSTGNYYQDDYNQSNYGNYNKNQSNYHENYQNYNYESQSQNQNENQNLNFYDQNPNFNRNKGNVFAKDTHKNQNYKKREYNRKNPSSYQQDSDNWENSQNQTAKPQPVHNINPNYNAEYSRIQGKLLDIEIRQEDEQNKEQIQEMRNLVKEKVTENYQDIIKDITNSTTKKVEDLSSRNILQEIIAKNNMILQNPDLITNIIEIVSSPKSDDDIQQDFIDLLGYDQLDTISELIINRVEIKELINVVKTYIEESEKNLLKIENQNMYGKSNPNSNITIEVMDNKNKKKKVQDIQKTHLTNLKVLQQLGFDNRFLRENEMLGLHEKNLSKGPVNIDAFSNVSRAYGVNNPKSVNDYITDSKRQKNHVEINVKPILGDRKPVTRVRVEDMPPWAQKCFSSFQEFNEIQSTVYSKAFKSDENLLICAPTGAGKTNIALLTILREIQKQLNSMNLGRDLTIKDFSNINWNFKIVYLVPLKALANEIVDKFKTTLSFLNIKVNEFSADVNLSKEQIDQTNLFVAIPEKWDLFTRKNDSIFDTLRLMIIDEVHLLNEDRGRVLECIMARTIRKMELNQKFIRFAGLSATLPNYWDVAEFLRVNDGLFYFDSSYRATPLKMKFLGVFERRSDEEYKDYENQIVYEEVVKYLEKGKQVLIFVHSRIETMNFARDLIRRAQMHGKDYLFQPGTGGAKSNSKLKSTRFMNKTLEELAPYGIGFHNAGLMRKDRNSCEALFANKTLNVLVSTSTLAWGVNLPAYLVIIKGVTFYDASKGCQTDMGILDIQQMFGRAGRPQFDKKGVAMIVSPFKKLDYFVNLLKNQIEIESKLPKFLCDALNAEIAIGNILNLDDAIGWLNLTYMAIRMRGGKNGSGYSGAHNDRLRDMANETFEILNKFKLIRYVKINGAVHSTELGRIACKYYMSYRSIASFYENLREDLYDEELLNLFAKSEEFSSMKSYPEEKKELQLLAENFDLLGKNMVDKKDVSNIPKPIILLQTYLKGYYEFKTSSLHMDCAYIVDNSTRIMRAILEISLHKHLVKTTFLCLNYVKLVERRVFPGSSPLWQFTYESNKQKQQALVKSNFDTNSEGYISPEICKKLDKNNSLTLEDLFTEDRVILSKLLNISREKVNDVIDYAKILPKFKIDIEIKPITRTILNVTINLTPIFKWKKRWNHLSEPFWIIVDDKKEIIHYEYYILPAKKSEKFSKSDKEKETVITFAIPYQIEPGEKEAREDKIYTISILSDRWLGVDFSHHVYLNEIEVPQDQDVHTELLDLFPLPKSALNNPDFEKLFSFSHFNPVQTQVFYSCYHSDENILVGAPTGSGKTAIAELAILRVFSLKPGGKIIYVAPLKSLAKERLRDWEKKLGLLGKKVLELTGDYTPDVKMLLEADLLITTPEKWDGISRNWHHRTYVQRVALVIIDEIHLLGLERGPVLEVIVSRMRYIAEKTKSSVRFVGLSTALANSYDVATWLGISTNFSNKKPPGLFNFKPAVRPCPVTVHIEGFSEKHYCPRMGTMNKPAYNAIREFSITKPVLVFVSSRRQTRLTALDLISLCANESGHSFLKISTDEMRNIIELVKDENLKHTLSFGIGMHHAGLVESDRRIVEDLFYNSSIQVLVATSTLAWGVNFPAHLVVIKGTEYYDPKLKSYVDMPITDILQMIGRAGRPQYDDCAVACLFVSQDKKNFYKKFLYEPFPLESTLHKMLHDHLNAEIAAGTLLSKQSCIEYITWTYFFRRLLKNPSYYGLKSIDAGILNEFLNKIVDTVLNDLAESKCITLHSDESISSTLLGYLSSFYYTSYKTAYGFEMTLKPKLEINNLIEILCDAQEFSQLPVRHNEEDLNEALAKLLPLEVDHLHLDSPHIKTNLLLQAHLSRVQLPISDYVTDSKLVLDNCLRILLFMIDITSEKGYLDTTINLVTLMQMIMQGVWLNDSSLLTLPNLGPSEVYKLFNSKFKICHLAELKNLIYGGEIEKICKFVVKVENTKNYTLEKIFDECKIKLNTHNEIREIKNALEKIPDIKLSYRCFKLNPKTLEKIYDSPIIPKTDTQISIRLEKINNQFDNLVTHSKFNKIKTCRWFLIIGNEKTNELLGIKKFSFRNITRKTIDFTCPAEIDDDSLQLYLMSDSYIGIDQQYPIMLNSINRRIIKKYNLKEEKSYVIIEKCTEVEDDSMKLLEDESQETDDEQNINEEVIFDNW